jgi:putative hydrolase of the HAD superfamily
MGGPVSVSTVTIVFFDVDDTLFSTSHFARSARANALRAMIRAGLQASLETCERELAEIVVEFGSNYEHHFDRLLQRLPEEAVSGRNAAVLSAAAVIAYHDTKFSQLAPYPEVPGVLGRLRDSGLRMGVITEGPAVKQAEKLLRLGLIEYFDPGAVFISDQLGISKPNPKLYRRACREAGVRPDEAMYVGDNAPNDVDPANEVGLKTVLCRRGGRHSDKVSSTPPTHVIRDFNELEALLLTEYDVADRPLDGQ